MSNKFFATEYSLADFYLPDTDNPLEVSDDWKDWRNETRWATSLYEQALLKGPRPVTRLDTWDKGDVVNMSSYNYLGMVNDERVIDAAKAALNKYGAGACGSSILSGMTDLHRELEHRMAAFLGREDCMLFSSGFGGALGILAGLLRKDDVALLDEKSHISLMDGVRLSGARLELFSHNDAASLRTLLEKHAGKRRVVVAEGVYSMDGDLGNLPELCAVAREHGVGVVVDEAHSILTFGEKGRGAVEQLNCEQDVILQYGTFSKAFAAVGGFVSGPKDLLGYLRFFANSYSFSCALPPSVVASILAVLDIFERDKSCRDKLRENTEYFRCELNAMGVNTGESVSQVVPVIVGSDRKFLYEAGIAMREKGLFLVPVDYPSVPEDGLRFRASVTAAHSRADLHKAIQIIKEVIVPHVSGQQNG